MGDAMEIFQTVQALPRRMVDAGGVVGVACRKGRGGMGWLGEGWVREMRGRGRGVVRGWGGVGVGEGEPGRRGEGGDEGRGKEGEDEEDEEGRDGEDGGERGEGRDGKDAGERGEGGMIEEVKEGRRLGRTESRWKKRLGRGRGR